MYIIDKNTILSRCVVCSEKKRKKEIWILLRWLMMMMWSWLSSISMLSGWQGQTLLLMLQTLLLLIIYWSFKKCFYHNDCSNVHNTSQFVCELRTTCTTWTRQCGTVALPMPYLCELCTCWSMCYVCVCLFIFLLYELITDVIMCVIIMW